jgi:hypothetical protein
MDELDAHGGDCELCATAEHDRLALSAHPMDELEWEWMARFHGRNI